MKRVDLHVARLCQLFWRIFYGHLLARRAVIRNTTDCHPDPVTAMTTSHLQVLLIQLVLQEGRALLIIA